MRALTFSFRSGRPQLGTSSSVGGRGPLRGGRAELERPANEALDDRPLGVGRGAKRYEARVLASALQQAAPVVELAPAVEKHRRMIGERADSHDVRAVDGVTHDLPHGAARPWWQAAIGDLIRLRSDFFDDLDRRLDRRTYRRRNLLELLGERELRWRHSAQILVAPVRSTTRPGSHPPRRAPTSYVLSKN